MRPVIVLATITACSGGGGTPERADARIPDGDVSDAAPNQAPVAAAGPDQVVGTGALISLDGSNSYDPELAPFTYSWLLASAPAASTAVLSDPQSATPEFLTDVAGVYLLTLVVHDGELASAPDFLVITAVDGMPVANAGADQTVPHGSLVTLNGTGSFDVDGETLGYAWAMGERPPGSAAMLDDAAAPLPTFTADLVGQYELDLIVHDGITASAVDSVVITATNAAPLVSAGMDRVVVLGDIALLVGTATDLEGDPLAIAWTLTAKPPGSAATPTPSAGLITALSIDEPGIYRLTLTVSDGFVTASDEVVVGTEPTSFTLAQDVADAEYSRSLDRLVLVSDDTGDLSILDPETGAEVTVALPVAPTSVSVAPNGLEAVVGHDGWVSVVDLVTAHRTATWPSSAIVGDVVHGGNGYAYAIPAVGQFETIRCVALATGTETFGAGSMGAGARGRRHPTQDAIYLATSTSPGDIEKYSIAGGTSSFVDDSPYHGEYPICGELWLSDVGTRIFTNCGHIFRSSTSPTLDMTHLGSFSDTDRVRHLDDSAAAQLVAVIPANPPNQPGEDIRVDVYEASFLLLDQSIPLPHIFVAGEWLQPQGQFSFFNQNGTALYVIMTAVPTTGQPRTVIWRAL